MTQDEILLILQDYVKKQNIQKIHLYTGNYSTFEYTDKLNKENLNAALIGQTFLKEEILMTPLLPFIKFINSDQYHRLISTYRNQLSQNKDGMINSLHVNKSLFSEFSKNNKEIYCETKIILKDRFSEVSDIFIHILAKKDVIIKKIPTLSYNIDLNQIIDLVRVKNFSWIENNLKDMLDTLKHSQETQKFLEFDKIFYSKYVDTTLTVHFVNFKKEELIESFMEILINKFIYLENNLEISVSKEYIEKIASHILLEHKLIKKEDKIKKNKL